MDKKREIIKKMIMIINKKIILNDGSIAIQ